MAEINLIAQIIATFFFVGKSKFIPGTCGSLAALLILVLISFLNLNSYTYLFGYAIVLVAGVASAHYYVSMSGVEDPQAIVIDEVLGMWLTLWGLDLHNVYLLIGGFILFRLFDIFKPLFIRKLEKLPGGFGVVADDLLAGLYANLVLRLIIRWVA